MQIDNIINEALTRDHFVISPDVKLEWEHLPQQVRRWEIFRGRLLPPAHTREERTFEEWNIYLIEDDSRSEEPLISIKRDAEALHVTRGLHCYVQQGYDSGGGVYLTREVQQWVNELIGTISLDDALTSHELTEELEVLLFHAFVGLSRLPLTSVEAPHPVFSFGKAYYAPSGGEKLRGLDRIKHFEFLLHTTPEEELLSLAQVSDKPLSLLRAMFNEISLSPYTGLVEKVVLCVDVWLDAGRVTPQDVIDFYGFLLRQSGRHLTAYDLITFHHRGANYPDALMLDTVLKAFLKLASNHRQLFEDSSKPARLRRRATRQGCLLRRMIEGQYVPDLPTSSGENLRVLPKSHPRVPEEQILNPMKRKRRLYHDDPLTNHLDESTQAILEQSIADLDHDAELMELGTAVFLDRPLGAAKAPGEPDLTVLLSHVAFSRSVARQRLRVIRDKLSLISPERCESLIDTLEHLNVKGIGLPQLAGAQRPGVVSVLDARQVADDFVYLRTTRSSLEDLFRQYAMPHGMKISDVQLALPGSHDESELPVLIFYDPSLTPSLILALDAGEGYVRDGATELVKAGLREIYPDH